MREVFRIEQVAGRDCDDCVRLLVAQLREHGIDTPEDAVRRVVEGALADPRWGRLLIARSEGVAIGVAYLSFVWSLEHGGLAAWLEELYVVPERREGGAGTALLHAVKGLCRSHGCAAIDLEVEESHARACALYEREGFERRSRSRWVRKIGRDSAP